MKQELSIGRTLMAVAFSAGFGLLVAGIARAHCDTTGGPVIPEATAALEKGDVTPILKWVKKDAEAEIKAAFAKAVLVRAKGPEAKELADQYFIETLVRLHRAGEGAPYTGIKNEPVEPIVAMADKALAAGSADEIIKKMSGHLSAAINEKFNKALKAQKNKDKSVEAGREFVEAYVTYMHYIEGIHTAIMSVGGHHAETAVGEAEHK
jgi:hypothetical protein